MKKLLIASLVITFLLIAGTVDDFLSLHDIKADYVSRAALEYLGIETSAALPPWTDTRLEWISVNVSYALRWVLLLTNLAVLVLLMKRLPSLSGDAAERKTTT